MTRERITGYQKALADAGIEQDPKLIYEGDYTMDSGSAALSYLMGQRVTAIFAQNDEMAFGVYRSARIYGISIPEELSLIGCDNVPFDDVLEVPLSTISVPAREMGSYIAEQLCNMVEEDQPASPERDRRRTVYYEPDLYLRGSVGKI